MSKGKKAVVFGGSGFIGSHVADQLTDKGYRVVVFDVKPSGYLVRGQEMVVGDITDMKKVRQVVKKADVVYNFAGISNIDEASRNPFGTVTVNILGNTVILESLKKCGIERYVFASTVYVYSDVGSFYRNSKMACELYINDYSKSYGIPFTILRYGSIYGPRSNKRDRVYMLVHQALTEGKMTYRGDGEEMRDYIHVEDAARCSVEILGKEYRNKNVIISGQQSMKVKALMIMIKEILKKDIKIEFTGKNSDIHYEITPYCFHPGIGKKYVSREYTDFGEGIIRCAEEIYNSLHHNR